MILLDFITNYSIFSRYLTNGERISMPIAHGEGNFQAEKDTLKKLEDNDCIAFKYSSDKLNNFQV